MNVAQTSLASVLVYTGLGTMWLGLLHSGRRCRSERKGQSSPSSSVRQQARPYLQVSCAHATHLCMTVVHGDRLFDDVSTALCHVAAAS